MVDIESCPGAEHKARENPVYPVRLSAQKLLKSTVAEDHKRLRRFHGHQQLCRTFSQWAVPLSPKHVKSRGSLNVPIPKHCGTLFLVPHCCVWVLEPSGESTAQAVPLHYNCVRTLGSYLAVMFNTPPSKLGNDFPLSQSSFRNSFPLENKLQNTVFLYLVADCSVHSRSSPRSLLLYKSSCLVTTTKQKVSK